MWHCSTVKRRNEAQQQSTATKRSNETQPCQAHSQPAEFQYQQASTTTVPVELTSRPSNLPFEQNSQLEPSHGTYQQSFPRGLPTHSNNVEAQSSVPTTGPSQHQGPKPHTPGRNTTSARTQSRPNTRTNATQTLKTQVEQDKLHQEDFPRHNNTQRSQHKTSKPSHTTSTRDEAPVQP